GRRGWNWRGGRCWGWRRCRGSAFRSAGDNDTYSLRIESGEAANITPVEIEIHPVARIAVITNPGIRPGVDLPRRPHPVVMSRNERRQVVRIGKAAAGVSLEILREAPISSGSARQNQRCRQGYRDRREGVSAQILWPQIHGNEWSRWIAENGSRRSSRHVPKLDTCDDIVISLGGGRDHVERQATNFYRGRARLDPRIGPGITHVGVWCAVGEGSGIGPGNGVEQNTRDRRW